MIKMNKLIYLDNAATTKTAQEAVDAMLPYFTEYYGNASSIYSLGAESKKAMTEAREEIAGHWCIGTGDLLYSRWLRI